MKDAPPAVDVMSWTAARLAGAPLPPLVDLPGRVIECRDDIPEDEAARAESIAEQIDRLQQQLGLSRTMARRLWEEWAVADMRREARG
ncbi:MAG: hypothetical protein QM750_23125 [Rubrivivax sp.]